MTTDTLNSLQTELLRRRDASEPNHSLYVTRIHEQADKIHQAIAEACKNNNYVWAHKDNSRVLKMGAVGPLSGTRFPTRWVITCRMTFIPMRSRTANYWSLIALNFAHSDEYKRRLTNRWSQPLASMITSSLHVYEVRPRSDKRGVDLISDVLPFGRLWYGGPNAASNAIGYAEQYSRAHDAVIRVYDEAANVIETHERAGDFREP